MPPTIGVGMAAAGSSPITDAVPARDKDNPATPTSGIARALFCLGVRFVLRLRIGDPL